VAEAIIFLWQKDKQVSLLLTDGLYVKPSVRSTRVAQGNYILAHNETPSHLAQGNDPMKISCPALKEIKR
jgi:hypothetical protein